MLFGVLALQGAFIEHIKILNQLNVRTKEIRQLTDLENDFDAFILPGGESSVIGKLLKDLGLFHPIKSQIENGKPVFGTCAGMILLAENVNNDTRQHFGTMNISVKRNAYGRQLSSFYTKAKFAKHEIEMPFIRAPYIEAHADDVEILSIVDDKIVAARQKNQLVTAFHPEVTENTFVHEYFIKMVENSK